MFTDDVLLHYMHVESPFDSWDYTSIVLGRGLDSVIASLRQHPALSTIDLVGSVAIAAFAATRIGGDSFVTSFLSKLVADPVILLQYSSAPLTQLVLDLHMPASSR
eukprot:11960484-Karenia_brevis.AAC.1